MACLEENSRSPRHHADGTNVDRPGGRIKEAVETNTFQLIAEKMGWGDGGLRSTRMS